MKQDIPVLFVSFGPCFPSSGCALPLFGSEPFFHYTRPPHLQAPGRHLELASQPETALCTCEATSVKFFVSPASTEHLLFLLPLPRHLRCETCWEGPLSSLLRFYICARANIGEVQSCLVPSSQTDHCGMLMLSHPTTGLVG